MGVAFVFGVVGVAFDIDEGGVAFAAADAANCGSLDLGKGTGFRFLKLFSG